jgi:arylsulfatase A-like enzyme
MDSAKTQRPDKKTSGTAGWTRRDFLRGFGVGALSLTAGGCAGLGRAVKAGRKRPNIVIIMADDMGFSDIGCYGGEIETPNLDRLAANGLRFTQFYNTARCCPTRASLLTGLYSHQAGMGHMVHDSGYPSYQGYLNEKCVTIAEVLKPAGYSTYMAGKWHVCPFDFNARTSSRPDIWPLKRGFDRFYGTIAGGGSYYNPPGLTRDNEFIKPDSPNYYYTDAVSDHAAKFITEHARTKPAAPFFMYVAYTSPHWPLHAPEDQIAKYKGVYDKGWDIIRAERYKRMIDMGIVREDLPLTPRDHRVKPWKDTDNKAWWARCMEVYAAQVDIMDRGIGRIVRSLEKADQLDNTLILFLSDNGGCAEVLGRKLWGIVDEIAPDGRPVRPGNDPAITPGGADTFASYGIAWANASNTPFRLYKHWVHEGGISTPLIAHWPDRIRRKGALEQQHGHVIDLMATCVDVAQAQYPSEHHGRAVLPMEGKSLAPGFGKRSIEREAIFWEHEGNRAVRQGKWKLVSRHPDQWELYDVHSDRTEMNDLADEHPQKVDSLRAMYESWAKRCGVRAWPVRK